MVSVKKFWAIVFITIALSFSLLAYADTYWVKGNKVKDKDGTEYLIFNDEHKVQLGFKVDGLNLVPIKDSKTDSIAKQKKIEKEKKSVANIQNFVNNLLKLSITLIGMVAIFLVVSILCAITWMIIGIVTIYKKS